MRNDADRIKDALECIDKIEKYAVRGRAVFDADELIQTWIVHYLQILSEALTKLDESTQLKNVDVPWNEIRGMRNLLVHQYFGIDNKVVWSVVESDLPVLRLQLEKLLEDV